MLHYVLSSGFDHIAHIDPGSIAVLEALRFLDSHVRQHPSHWDRLCEFREEDLRWPYPPWPSSRHDIVLYMLIAYSSPPLLQSFLSAYHTLKPRLGTNPLVYAADLRQTAHAMTLLEYGANANVSSLVADGSHKASPLEVAIDVGDDVLVGELLRRECVVKTEVLSTAVCMPWCSTRVLAKLMQTAEFVEWAKEIGHEKLFRGVFNSARPNAGDRKKADQDYVVLAGRLREIGQDLSPHSLFGSELIERALHAAYTSMLEYLLPPNRPPPSRLLLLASTGDTSEAVYVVRWLLRKGVNVNAASNGSDTALHFVASCPWEPRSLELTKMLIDAGCNSGMRNLRGETPLAIAVRREYLSVVECMLASTAPSPVEILSVALQGRSTPQMIEVLVRNGADVNSTTQSGNTVLHLAVPGYSESTCLSLVKIFMRAGVNATTRNSLKKTVFELAVERGYTSVVEHLISCHVPIPANVLVALQNYRTPQMTEVLVRNGADVNSTTQSGDTVLHLAVAKYSQSTCLNLVKIFVGAGVNLAVRNSRGKTVFELALERGYTSMVEYLISCHVPLPANVLLVALHNHATPRMIDIFVRNGAVVNSTTQSGDTVLHLAVTEYSESTCLDLVKIFVGAGVNVVARNSSRKQSSTLRSNVTIPRWWNI